MRNIRFYPNINGKQWLGVEIDGRIFLITYLGEAGSCVRP